MATNNTRICFERIIPSELTKIARQKAIAENPANASRSTFEAAVLRSKLWKPGRTLRVTFLDGHPIVQTKIEYYASLWSQYANITFVFATDPDAEIRISFKGQGSWSAIGTDALVAEYYPYNSPTMNYGWLTPDSSEKDYSSVVLHEFGHALGMIHEHQNPTNPIQWNEQEVIAALSGPPTSGTSKLSTLIFLSIMNDHTHNSPGLMINRSCFTRSLKSGQRIIWNFL
jgi:Matrixin